MRSHPAANVTLWILQSLLALFFAAGSGLPKFILPADQLNMPLPLPTALLYFIGVCEILGALGLILPSLTRVRPQLTPLAGLGLVLLTLCATVYQLLAGQPESAVFAAVMGLLCAVVAYGRWRIAPIAERSRRALDGAVA